MSESQRDFEVGLIASTILGGGDDYEILLAVPPERGAAFLQEAAVLPFAVTMLGTLTEGRGVEIVDAAGTPVLLSNSGYEHFKGRPLG